jgi:indoleamine 2,3-dioxygenase
MPAGHVAFLEELERGPSVREFALNDRGSKHVYDDCIELVEAFRTTHLEYAARYIQKQAEVGANSTAYGTGGTPFMRYLRKHRDETGASRLSA